MIDAVLDLAVRGFRTLVDLVQQPGQDLLGIALGVRPGRLSRRLCRRFVTESKPA